MWSLYPLFQTAFRIPPGFCIPGKNAYVACCKTLQYTQKLPVLHQPCVSNGICIETQLQMSRRNFQRQHYPSNHLYGSCCILFLYPPVPVDIHRWYIDCHDLNDESTQVQVCAVLAPNSKFPAVAQAGNALLVSAVIQRK